MFDRDGNLLPLHRMPENARRAVKRFKTRGAQQSDGAVQGLIVEIDLHDKLRALRDLGDGLGIYKQVHEPHYPDELRAMTDEELDREEQRVEAELQRAIVERNRVLDS